MAVYTFSLVVVAAAACKELGIVHQGLNMPFGEHRMLACFCCSEHESNLPVHQGPAQLAGVLRSGTVPADAPACHTSVLHAGGLAGNVPVNSR